ncbi:effector-associated constant component EACC1 [Streptomyces acidicola]|uniref:effector-associated constant component EACC1 n=1 Tax=Streptomyces acidicola TaxID=2596892 RepID=UPI00343D3BB7
MEIRFWTGGSDQDEDQRQDVRSLHEWLMDDRDLRLAGVRIEAVVGAAPGQMGVGPEEIGAVCGALSLGLQLVDSVRAWRSGRRPTSTINVSVLGGDPGQVEQIVAALRIAGFVLSPQGRDESHEPTVSPGPPPADPTDSGPSGRDGEPGGNGNGNGADNGDRQ